MVVIKVLSVLLCISIFGLFVWFIFSPITNDIKRSEPLPETAPSLTAAAIDKNEEDYFKVISKGVDTELTGYKKAGKLNVFLNNGGEYASGLSDYPVNIYVTQGSLFYLKVKKEDEEYIFYIAKDDYLKYNVGDQIKEIESLQKVLELTKSSKRKIEKELNIKIKEYGIRTKRNVYSIGTHISSICIDKYSLVKEEEEEKVSKINKNLKEFLNE